MTLGTPHHVTDAGPIGSQIGVIAARFADRTVPGATFAPRTAYVSVMSRGISGRPDGDARSRSAWRMYTGLLGPSDVDEIDGDGLVPCASARLDGAIEVCLDDAVHGQLAGSPWYGSDGPLDVWWPIALEAWHAALRARVEGSTG